MRFETADEVSLAGALFEPRGGPAPACLLWMHGTGGASVFSARRTNLLAPPLLAHGIAFFPFDNRGAQIVRRAGSGLGGSAFERIRDCVLDVDAAARELHRRGYRELFLAGHSTGANKVAVYDRLKPRNRFKRYVLLAGGDDTRSLHDELGPRRFRTLLAKARTMIRARRGDELMPDRLMSWRAFYDVANPDGDYNVFPFHDATGCPLPFAAVRGIRKPALYVYGDRDEYEPDVAQLAQHIGPRAEIAVLEDADHGFSGREGEVGELIAAWLTGEAS